MTDQQPTFAQFLRAARLRAEMTQTALANAAGLRQSVISDLESGTAVNPRAATVQSLAAALGIDFADFGKVTYGKQGD
jgi:transcriptional regulator with XRE-family HTH domain